MKVGDDQRKQIFNVGVDVFLREGGPISAPHVDQVLPIHLKLVFHNSFDGQACLLGGSGV